MKKSRFGELSVALLAVLSLVFLLGIIVFHHGSQRTGSSIFPAQKPDKLKIVFSNPLHQSNMDATSTIVNNRKWVHDFYNKLKNLPAFPSGPISCPMDDGTYYQLVFSKNQQVILTAKVERTGCEGVSFFGSKRSALRAGPDFTFMLKQVLEKQK